MPRIFVSYRRADSITITGRIYDRLVAVFGEDGVFKDVEDIPFGVDFRSVIEHEIDQSEIVLVIIGPNWVTVTDTDGNRRLDNPNDFVRIEVETAIKRPTALVIPVLVQGARMPKADELPESLQPLHYRNAAVLREDPDFRSDIERMITTMREYFRSHDTRPFRGALPQFDDMAKAASSRAMWLVGALALLAVIIVAVLLFGSNRGGQTPTPTSTRTTPTAATEVAQAVSSSTVAATEDNTPTRTDTLTPTDTDTLTPSDTLTPTETDTLAPSDTLTPTETDTLTPSDTFTPSRTPTRTSTLSPTQLEETLSAVMIEVQTQNYETDMANLTETATLWTPTPTFDARGTASARLRETGEAQRAAATATQGTAIAAATDTQVALEATATATQGTAVAAATGTQIALEATATAESFTETPTRTPTLTPTPFGGGTGNFAYSAIPIGEETYEVFSWSPLGGPRRLSDTPYRAANAVWSPDGQRMAFTSEREDGRSDIFVMRIPNDSTRMPEVEQISDGSTRYTYLSPQWTPDGASIFYIATDGRLIDSLRVFNIVEGEERRLTTFNGVEYYDALSISPDGEQIAFASQRDGNWEIYVMEIDGSNVRRLTSNRADDRDPAWSPDGTQIAFVSARDGFLEVYVTDTAGSALRQLTDSSENKRKPVWSPDGSYIVFNGTIDGEAGNFLVSVTAGTDSEPFRLSGDSTDAVSDWQLTHQ